MILVKIGGGAGIRLEEIVRDLAQLEEPFVIVHGANALRDEIVLKMGLDKQVITSASGYSSVFSDKNALDAILMAYSGLRNKRLVELCLTHNILAVGLTGLDGRIVQGQRNRGIRVVENGKKILKRDFSGKPRSINTALLTLLISQGYTPVITIPICDENGFAINSENDDIVCEIQKALNAETVIQLIEAKGLMEDINDPDSLIPNLSRAGLARMEQKATGRIKRKMHALNKLAQSGVGQVIICDGRTRNPVRNGLSGGGTRIQ
ncbi:MAG: [LysW]-aminoadipate kinase [Gammaproteobacteria bacterium]|nr:[LysW]-aminoadipate kinase [Gammaproteobacteria bacterium]